MNSDGEKGKKTESEIEAGNKEKLFGKGGVWEGWGGRDMNLQRPFAKRVLKEPL